MKNREELQTFRALTPSQISDKITESRTKLLRLNQEKLLGKVNDVHGISRLKKSIARLSTLLDEKLTNQITKE